MSGKEKGYYDCGLSVLGTIVTQDRFSFTEVSSAIGRTEVRRWSAPTK